MGSAEAVSEVRRQLKRQLVEGDNLSEQVLSVPNLGWLRRCLVKIRAPFPFRFFFLGNSSSNLGVSRMPISGQSLPGRGAPDVKQEWAEEVPG